MQEQDKNQQTANEYDLISYELACDAIGIVFWDIAVVDGDIRNPKSTVMWSQKLREMLGYTDETDFPNKVSSIEERIHPEDADWSIGIVDAHLNDKTGQSPFDVEYRLMMKNGEYKHFRAFGATLRDEAGVPLKFAGALMDIDEMKKTQNQLMIMSGIVHNSPNFISYKKLSGECLYVNPAATTITEYSHEELMKDYLGELFGSKAAAYSAVVQMDMRKNGVATFEYEFKTKSGGKKVATGTTFFVESDAFATIAMDTTKAKKAEIERIKAQESRMEMMESLEKSNKLLQAVNEAATLLLTTRENEDIKVPITKSMEMIGNAMDADRIHIWRNETLNGQMQHTRAYSWFSETDQLKSKMPGALLNSPERMASWRQKFLHGECINGPVSKLPKSDRDFLKPMGVASIALIPLFFDNMFWGLFSVVNCRREYEFTEDEINILRSVSLMIINAINRHALIEQRTHDLAIQTAALTTLIDSIPGLAFTKDLNSRIMHCNKAFSEHFGIPMDKIIGRTATDGIVSPKELGEKHNEEDRMVIRENKTFKIEEHIPRADGTNPLFETTKMPLTLDGVIVGVVGIAYDITELKKAQETAEVANLKKSAFLEKMSNEILTPLNAIIEMTNNMLQDKNLPGNIEDGLNKIHDSCSVLLEIINDLPDFSKTEAGK